MMIYMSTETVGSMKWPYRSMWINCLWNVTLAVDIILSAYEIESIILTHLDNYKD